MGMDGNPTGISVVVQDDLTLYNMTLIHANGEDIIKEIKKVSLGVLNIFFLTPTVLWCGLTYTAYTKGSDPFGKGEVRYRLGWNLKKENSLRERIVEGEPVQINLNCVLPTGQKVQTASEANYAKNREHTTVNNIRDKDVLQRVANEMQYKRNYTGYEGAVNGFLNPFCEPGYKVNLIDNRYEERNGVYLAEATEVTFGMGGAWRKVEIGPKIGFNPKPTK